MSNPVGTNALKVALHHRSLQRRRLTESEEKLWRALERFQQARLEKDFEVMGGLAHLQVLNAVLDGLRDQVIALVYWAGVCALMKGTATMDGSE